MIYQTEINSITGGSKTLQWKENLLLMGLILNGWVVNLVLYIGPKVVNNSNISELYLLSGGIPSSSEQW